MIRALLLAAVLATAAPWAHADPPPDICIWLDADQAPVACLPVGGGGPVGG
jgi:hypothetical protein